VHVPIIGQHELVSCSACFEQRYFCIFADRGADSQFSTGLGYSTG